MASSLFLARHPNRPLVVNCKLLQVIQAEVADVGLVLGVSLYISAVWSLNTTYLLLSEALNGFVWGLSEYAVHAEDVCGSNYDVTP